MLRLPENQTGVVEVFVFITQRESFGNSKGFFLFFKWPLEGDTISSLPLTGQRCLTIAFVDTEPIFTVNYWERKVNDSDWIFRTKVTPYETVAQTTE